MSSTVNTDEAWLGTRQAAQKEVTVVESALRTLAQSGGHLQN